MFCNTSRGRMKATGNSSKRLLVCLGAQIVLQANTAKPRSGLNIGERDKRVWRPLYCCSLLSWEHYNGCCPGRILLVYSAVITWLVPWVNQSVAVSGTKHAFWLRPRRSMGVSLVTPEPPAFTRLSKSNFAPQHVELHWCKPPHGHGTTQPGFFASCSLFTLCNSAVQTCPDTH